VFLECQHQIFMSARIRAGSRYKRFLCFVLISLCMPYDVFTYPRLKTTGLDDVGASTSQTLWTSTASYRDSFTLLLLLLLLLILCVKKSAKETK
jgi:hypothetical protein